jgi:3-oxoacyl-[acyl-carrier-protein] synthase II
MSSSTEVVITGLGAISPVGVGVDAFKAAGRAGKTGVSAFKGEEAATTKARIAAEVKDFDPATVLDAKQVRLAARLVQFAVGSAVQANGCMDNEQGQMGDVANFGTIVGTAIGGLEVITEQMEILKNKGPRRVSPFAVPQLMDNAASAWVALRWGFRGPAYSVSTSCATSMDAIGVGYDLIRSGRLDGCLVGGADTPLVPYMFATFDRADLLSRATDTPELAERPFDRDRDGVVLGEGCCLMMLERRDRAEKRGARILARVAGYGATSRPQKELLATAPDGRGLTDAIKLAMKEAGISAADIGYLSANGMGIRASDVSEARAIHAALGEHAARIPVGATKSLVGYTFGAAGAFSALAAVLAVSEGHLSPITSFRNPDPDCALNIIKGEARVGAPVKYALANAMGFGGANSAILFGAP